MPWSSWALWGLSADQILIRDTLYYGESATSVIADLATDQSQFADNQTTGATWHYEPSPATNYRAASLQSEWTIDARVTANNADTGRLVWHGTSLSGDVITLRIAAGVIDAILGASVVGSLVMPSVSGTDNEWVITWTCQPNPDTTGAGDACRSWLYIWNLTAGTFDRTTFTHVARAAITASPFIWWANSTAGANPFTGAPLACRFSFAYHTATETAEELVSPSSAPTLAGEERVEILVPPRSTGIGDDGYLSGPTIARAAAAIHQNDLRLAGPLVNLEARTRATHRGDLVGDEPFTYPDPDLAGVYLYAHWLGGAPIPPGVNRVKARAFVQQWRTTGDDDTLRIVCYSMNRPGWVYQAPASPGTVDVRRNEQTRLAADGSGATAGTWITFDNLRIARDNDGWSYFALGFGVTDAGGAGSTDDQLWTVKYFIVDPIFEDAPDALPGLGS